MAGSRKGKRKNKGKSKSNKSETTGKKSEELNSKLDPGQASSSNPSGSSITEFKNPQTDTIFSSAKKTPLNLEADFERYLYLKLVESYNTARERLLTLGYSEPDVEAAILSAGYVHGHADLVNNIIHNAIRFIEKDFNLTREPFKDMVELCKTMFEEMVNYVMQTQPDMQRTKAMWHLLVTRWDLVSSASTTEKTLSSLKNDSSLKKICSFKPIDHFGDIEENLGMLVNPSTSCKKPEASNISSGSFLENCSDGLKTRIIDDMVTQIRSLQEEVKCHKKWAQQKVIVAAKKLTANALELKELQMYNDIEVKGKSKDVKTLEEVPLMVKLREKEKSLEQANSEANLLADAVKKMEFENSEIRSKIAEFKLIDLESRKELKKVSKREKRRMKRLAELESQTNVLRSHYNEEKQRMMQLKEELTTVEKEAGDAEEKRKNEIKAKERLLVLVAQETKNAEIQKARSTAHLQKLRQQLESDIQKAENKRRELEDELSCLRISLQVEDLLAENSNFLTRYDKASPSGSCGPSERKAKDHWTCMMCMANEVCVLFLPCKHAVLCFPCYGSNCKAVGSCCPYCCAGIEEAVKLYV